MAAPPLDEKKTENKKKQSKRRRGDVRREKVGGTKSPSWRKSVFPDDDAFSLVSGEEGGKLTFVIHSSVE